MGRDDPQRRIRSPRDASDPAPECRIEVRTMQLSAVSTAASDAPIECTLAGRTRDVWRGGRGAFKPRRRCSKRSEPVS